MAKNMALKLHNYLRTSYCRAYLCKLFIGFQLKRFVLCIFYDLRKVFTSRALNCSGLAALLVNLKHNSAAGAILKSFLEEVLDANSLRSVVLTKPITYVHLLMVASVEVVQV